MQQNRENGNTGIKESANIFRCKFINHHHQKNSEGCQKEVTRGSKDQTKLKVIQGGGLLHKLVDEDSVVAQALWVVFGLVAEALIGLAAGIVVLVGTLPVGAAFVARLSSPARLADAEVGSSIAWGVAESVVAVQMA